MAPHVQRMLKLANLAPELIALLAENKLDVEQCQALSLENDPARQVEIYNRVKAQHSYAPAHMLKRAVTDTEIALNHSRFVFIGRELYESAGGVVREDLFSAQEEGGTADGVLVERLVQEKLESAALAIELQEGGHGHWPGRARSEIMVTLASIICFYQSRRHSSPLTSSSVSMNCTPLRRPLKRLKMKPRFRY